MGRRHRYPIFVGLVLAVGLALPFALRQNAWFEWSNPYWLLLQQRAEILSSGRPSYFIHTYETGLYYPVNLFYAGFTLSLLGYAASLVPPPIVFSASIVAGFFAAFMGILWLAGALEVDRSVSTLAASLYVANPQFLGKLYARGAWAELIAIAMLTLLLGSAARMMADRRAGRSSRLSTAFVAIATALLPGTHNLTFALSVPFAVVVIVAVAWCLHGDAGSTARALIGPSVAALVGLAIAGVYVIPNMWLSGSTAVTAMDFLDRAPELNTISAVFQPHVTSSASRINEAPSLIIVPIAFLCAAAVLQPRRSSMHAMVPLIASALLALALTVLTTQGSLWSDPNSVLHRIAPEKALRTIQLPLRLTAFLTLALVVALLSLEAGTTNGRLKRVARATLAFSAAWYVVSALVFAVSSDRTPPERSETSYGSIRASEVPDAFAPVQQTQFLLTERGSTVDRPESMIVFNHDGEADAVTTEPGVPYATNVVWSPLARFVGADLRGRDATGMAVIVVQSPDSSGITVTSSRPLPMVAGAVTSVAGLAAGAWWLIAGSAMFKRSLRRM